ncbi:DUF4998 domain-containing protein [Chitinophaga sp. Cy-1792]|uniref:DUF4998 domain-containing protein n=1 Tax=Chitinophaga sp. Cy-1792 TaxID=2608339 RepID=UPI0014224030|nr:DUF4998 domain-containing protein [Chitinophaga sp. Cy-1792]NIG54962.1 DUF4998 domain-containing protein [Chitinophaga sp. Cy-1792]
MLKKLILSVAVAAALPACTKMDDNYKDRLVPNGIVYTGKAADVKIWPGRERAIISWLRGSDPRIKKATIYWNSKADSLTVDVPAKGSLDTIFAPISSIKEGTYTFSVVTTDGAGNYSVKVDSLGTIYGPLYESRLSPRAFKSVSVSGQNLIVRWFKSGDPTAISTTMNYTDNNGKPAKFSFGGDPDSVILLNYKATAKFTYSTMYVPGKLAIDSFYSRVDTIKVQ